VLATDYVVNLVTEPGIIFMNETVFATAARAPGDLVAKRLGYVTRHG
jgi:hypothetical protein